MTGADPAWVDGRDPALHRLTRRRGLPLLAVRADRRLTPLNADRLRTPGRPRAVPEHLICAVAYHAELRPTAREVLAHLLDPAADVVPRRRALAGLPVTDGEAQAFRDTEFAIQSALAAAARHLDLPVVVTGRGVRVDGVRLDGVRARSLPLRPGDRIVAADRTPVGTVETLLDLLRDRDEVQLSVMDGRPGTEEQRTEELVRRDDGRWGLAVSTDRPTLTTPLDVRLDLPGDLCGASLGLAVGLAVLDAVTDGSLSRAGHVVATGALSHHGEVGEVSGLELKARAVAAHPEIETFLVPTVSTEQLGRLRRLAPRTRVQPVGSLSEAVALLARERR